MTLDGIKLKFRNKYLRITAKMRGKKLQKKSFTIISNNCWGGLVYESYGIDKQTPTVGMFFMAEEYIKFISNLEYYTKCEMQFVEPEKSRHKKFYALDSKFGSYPIARVGDVEIALLHYHYEEDAKEKWNRRCKRINWDHLLIKMNDQNECSVDHVNAFLSLPFKNKVFFTVREELKSAVAKNKTEREIVYLKSNSKNCCGLFDEPFGASKKMNINDLINSI